MLSGTRTVAPRPTVLARLINSTTGACYGIKVHHAFPEAGHLRRELAQELIFEGKKSTTQ